jgi:hypothetical protein
MLEDRRKPLLPLAGRGRPKLRPQCVVADKGYSSENHAATVSGFRISLGTEVEQRKSPEQYAPGSLLIV